MNIVLDDLYRIVSDDFSLILEKSYFSKKKNKTSWRAAGYYNTLDALLSGLVRKKIYSLNSETISELLESLKRIELEITELNKKFSLFKKD